jgi:hypothetical protein
MPRYESTTVQEIRTTGQPDDCRQIPGATTVSLEDAPQAMQALLERRASGKLVVSL